MPRTVALVVAAGRGNRFGGDLPKQWHDLDGRPVLRHSLGAFSAHPDIQSVRVVIHPDDTTTVRIARSEMGQGTLTGLAQLVAEDLECDWSKVKAEYVKPEENLGKTENSSTFKFFVDVQGKTKLETNLQSAGLLPHYNTFEARAMRVVISDLPPRFPDDQTAESEEQDVTDDDGDKQQQQRNNACNRGLHRLPPCCGWPAVDCGVRRGVSSFKGRNGTTPCPDEPPS